MDDLRATIRLDLDNRGFVGEVRLSDRELEKLARTVGQTSAPSREAARATDDLTRSTRRAGSGFPRTRGDRPFRYTSGCAS